MTANSSDQPSGIPPGTDTANARDRVVTEVSELDALDYLRTILSDLTAIARRHRLDMLGYLIEMAYVEASDAIARKRVPGRQGRERRKAEGGFPASGAGGSEKQ